LLLGVVQRSLSCSKARLQRVFQKDCGSQHDIFNWDGVCGWRQILSIYLPPKKEKTHGAWVLFGVPEVSISILKAACENQQPKGAGRRPPAVREIHCLRVALFIVLSVCVLKAILWRAILIPAKKWAVNQRTVLLLILNFNTIHPTTRT
jgi:hypothetical protein